MEGEWATLFNKIARWGYALSQKYNQGSRKNIALHYDLGNDFYELMLDPTMTSVRAHENTNTTLEEASLAKYDRIIDQLEIKPENHLLEIGCGWGGFAQRLAERTSARLTATTISEQQYQYSERIRKNGWEDRISIVKQDYRNLTGQFDGIVSIEMIEAVGHSTSLPISPKFPTCSLPTPLIQGITMPDHRYGQYLKEVDYIRTRVFSGQLRTLASAMIAAAVKRSDLRPAALHDFGYHYSRTSGEWRIRFKENEDKIEALGYDDSFRKAWSITFATAKLALRKDTRRHPSSPRQTRV